MEIKQIEQGILKIYQDLNNFLDSINKQDDLLIETYITDSKIKVDEKLIFLKEFEENIKKDDDLFKSKIIDLENEIDKLVKKTNTNLHNLDNVKVELEKQKQEKFKNYLLAQKKKKTEIINKITALKKDLSTFHKENNSKLLEEEKEFRSRELELSRRMGIDIERINENNIKQYIDIEKSILDLEDEVKIKEAQKKINSIRAVGLKEALNVRNKYSLLFYENSLEFKKFQQKIILDNSTVTEEFKNRIKILEHEKVLIEEEEKYNLNLADFEKELKMLDIQKANELDLINQSKTKHDKINENNNLILDYKKRSSLIKADSVKKFNTEMNNFDKVQINSYKIEDHNISESEKKIFDNIITYIRELLVSFKHLLIVSLNNIYEKRKRFMELINNHLSLNYFDKIVEAPTNYHLFLNELIREVNDYVKAQKAGLNKINLIINQLFANLENQMTLSLLLVRDYRKEEEMLFGKFYNSLMKKLDSGYNEVVNNLNKDVEIKGLEITKTNNINKEEYKKNLEIIKNQTKKIENDYNINKKNILDRELQYKKDYKLIIEKEKINLKKFQKQIKDRINQLRLVYNDNISNHEKVEHKKYKELLKENQIDYKNRLESL